MQELEKILEVMRQIKDGNRKENLYAKYPPNGKDQEVLNAYSQGYEDGTDNFYNAVVYIIRKYMENDGWIPVEERLPEDDDMVLVTCQTKKGVRSVNRAYYDGIFWHGIGSMSGVVAWRPLPEPYRPEGSDVCETDNWKEHIMARFEHVN